jgi:hypothetical protein
METQLFQPIIHMLNDPCTLKHAIAQGTFFYSLHFCEFAITVEMSVRYAILPDNDIIYMNNATC